MEKSVVLQTRQARPTVAALANQEAAILLLPATSAEKDMRILTWLLITLVALGVFDLVESSSRQSVTHPAKSYGSAIGGLQQPARKVIPRSPRYDWTSELSLPQHLSTRADALHLYALVLAHA